jgi:hypothetical protein
MSSETITRTYVVFSDGDIVEVADLRDAVACAADNVRYHESRYGQRWWVEQHEYVGDEPVREIPVYHDDVLACFGWTGEDDNLQALAIEQETI